MEQIQIQQDKTADAEYEGQRAAQPIAAETCVADEHAATAEGALSTARAEVTRYARRHTRLTSITVITLTLFTVLFTVAMQWLIKVYGDSTVFWARQFPTLIALNMTLFVASAAGLLWSTFKRARGMGRHVDVLADQPDKRSIGALVDLLKCDDLATHRKAQKVLTAILPEMRASDAHLLSRKNREALNRYLGQSFEELGYRDIRELFMDTKERETKFRLAILQAYQQAGDMEALPIVQRLAISEAKSAAGKRVRAAAVECLPYLKILIEKQSAQGSLLRGSAASSSAVPDATLLRPASSQHGHSSADLLRPTESA